MSGPVDAVPRIVADAIIAWGDLWAPLQECGGSPEEWNVCNAAFAAIGDAVRTYASQVVASLPAAPQAAAPSTVGAALGLPQVQDGSHVVEYATPRTPPSIGQLRVVDAAGGGVLGRWRNAYGWEPWTAATIRIATVPLPCRLVPADQADRDPSTRTPPTPSAPGDAR